MKKTYCGSFSYICPYLIEDDRLLVNKISAYVKITKINNHGFYSNLELHIKVQKLKPSDATSSLMNLRWVSGVGGGGDKKWIKRDK